MNVFALDFDGVLCDSVAEAAVAAWRAGSHIWSEWRGAEPPPTCLSRFINLRPLVETGYETILLMRLIQLGLPDNRIESGFSELCGRLLGETDCTPQQLARLFGQTRDDWITQDREDWLSRHRFYPRVIERFVQQIEMTPVVIVTTKQEHFVSALLEGQGVRFPNERVFGLDTGKTKEAVLEQLLECSEFPDATWHFVEDRLATLIRVAGRKSLRQVHLYLADWGYNTAKDREQAQEYPRITLWNSERFLMV